MSALMSWLRPAAVQPAARGALSSQRSAATRLIGDQSGTISIIFSLTAAVVIVMVGGAVDYGRWLNARNQTQNALDAALLAAGRVLQTQHGDRSQALATARTYYDRMKTMLTARDEAVFDVVDDGTALKADVTAYVKTPFLSPIGIYELPIMTGAKVVLSAGGNSETSVEVGLMLDVTGSMAGQKIKDMKTAAKDLIDIVVWDNQSEYYSKIAIAPFSARVNTGSHTAALTGMTATWNSKKIKACVTERTGSAAFTDDAPANNKYLNAYAGDRVKDNDNYSSNGSCSDPSSSEEITPLTKDKAVLKAHIDALTDGGSTAGQLGTAWAWYLISPNWSSIWTGDSAPAPYSKLTQMGQNGQPALQKIAILMTDGAYNTTAGTSYSDNSSQARTISQNAVTICSNMKAKGIIVYTVGFQLGGATLPIDTLKSCATDASHFYNSTTGEELRQAFRDIALKISTLRVAK
jgi:Flp pilus assembly protein TadG